MARSTYKKHLLTYDDLYFFYSKISFTYNQRVWSARNKTITALTCRELFSVHQGRSFVDTRSTVFSVGKKVGEFSKTRKPFFFRSKKKKR